MATTSQNKIEKDIPIKLEYLNNIPKLKDKQSDGAVYSRTT